MKGLAKIWKIGWLGLLVWAISPGLSLGQSVDTAIQGIVLRESSEPIAAATIYLHSPSLIGVHLALTDKSGFFYLPGLRPGNYTLTVEKPGYKGVVIESLWLRSGQTIFIKIKLAPSEKEGEIGLVKTPASGDMASAQIKTFFDSSLFCHLPLGRNLSFLLKATPQVALDDSDINDGFILLGSSGRNSLFYFEDINLTDNLSLKPASDLDLAIIESLEIMSSAQELGQVPAGATHVNIISRSGGNNFSGDLGFSAIFDSWNKDLWRASELSQKGVPSVSGIKSEIRPFFSLGGRFWADRAWLYLAGQYERASQENIFPAPFVDVHGEQHESYDITSRLTSGFFKLTVRPIAEAQASAWVNFSQTRKPATGDFSLWLPYLSTSNLDHDDFFSLNASGHYFLDRKTIIDGRAGYLTRTSLLLLQEKASQNFWSDDRGDRFGPLTGADFNSETKIEQISGEAEARRFVASRLGLRHILKAGFSFNQTTSYLDWWRANNLVWFLDSRRANNYFYSGQGLIGFWLCGTVKTSTLIRGQTQRLGGYLGETLTLGHRLTLDFSVRLDRVSGGLSAASKATSGNPLAYFVGEAVIKPFTKSAYPDVFPDGLNPWGVLTFSDRGDFLSWLSLTPRLGVVVNLWGEGKTLLKGSWALYHDDLTPRSLLPLHPLYPGFIPFFWLDANGNGRPDLEDEFLPQSFDFRSLSNSYLEKRIADDLSSPQFSEISLGAEHHFNPNLSLTLKFISREEKNILADVPYDLAREKAWYRSDEADSSKYWLPFTTTIPATPNFPAQTITFFVRSNQIPVFRQWRNVSELQRKYRAFEFNLDKKMSGGWGLLAALILSRAEGNVWGQSGSMGASRELIEANYFLNRQGRLESDRPVVFKLAGALELPLGFNLGVFYQYQSGRPWTRRVSILPPANWCYQRGGERVYYELLLEPAGSNREKGFSFLDLRLEKKMRLGPGSELWLYLDALNLLGQKREIRGLNDIDIWEPVAEGANKSGKLYYSPDYQLTRELLGKRVFRLTLKLAF